MFLGISCRFSVSERSEWTQSQEGCETTMRRLKVEPLLRQVCNKRGWAMREVGVGRVFLATLFDILAVPTMQYNQMTTMAPLFRGRGMAT